MLFSFMCGISVAVIQVIGMGRSKSAIWFQYFSWGTVKGTVTCMPDKSPQPVTELLQAWSAGDPQALARLVPMVYDDLRRIAKHRVSFGHEDISPEPSSLVNELYLRLAASHDLRFSNRTQFFGLAAQILRRARVDAARARASSKRGGNAEKVSFDEADFASPEKDREIVALDDALQALAKVDARKAQAVELRFFGGLTMEETAETMGISVQTVRRDWQVAQAWLSHEVSQGRPGESAAP